MQVTDEMVRVAAGAICCKAHECGCAANHDGSPFTTCQLPTYMDDARSALTAALAAMWRDIKDAPKDGTPIAYTNGQKIDATFGVCRWSVFPEDDYAEWWDFERDCEACPKYWAPVSIFPQFIPAPPATEVEIQKRPQKDGSR